MKLKRKIAEEGYSIEEYLVLLEKRNRMLEKDSEDLIDKLEKFINLPYEEKKAMGLAARAKVEKEFNRQIVVRKYLDELNRISYERLSKHKS